MSNDPRCVLVVDDQSGIRRLLFEALSEDGYRVETAASGMEAVRKVRMGNPSLVLLDIRMPGMSGLDAMKLIKQLKPELPVILMTVYVEAGTVLEAKKSGQIQYFFEKPFDIGKIRKKVKEILTDGLKGDRGCCWPDRKKMCCRPELRVSNIKSNLSLKNGPL